MAHVVFIHGLNTYGDDDLHIGPLKFGAMGLRLEQALAKRGVRLQVVKQFGSGSPEEQADFIRLQLPAEAQAQVLSNDSPIGPLHLLGHSTGGLIARVLAAKLGDRVQSIITWGTPHAGSNAAEFGLEVGAKFSRLGGLMKTFGYDPKAKSEIFRFFTPQAMLEFNKKYPPKTREFTLLCEAKLKDLSWPLLPFYIKLHPNRQPSDGFISSESQRRGETLGPFGLDHFGGLGFFPHMDPRARTSAQCEFERLTDEIARLVSK